MRVGFGPLGGVIAAFQDQAQEVDLPDRLEKLRHIPGTGDIVGMKESRSVGEAGV